MGKRVVIGVRLETVTFPPDSVAAASVGTDS